MPFKTTKEKRDYDRERYRKMSPEQKAKIIEQRRVYYVANKKKILARTRIWTKARIQRHIEIIDKAKAEPCMDCGTEYPPCVMDFDHRDPSLKRSSIAALRRNWQVSTKSLLEEMAKCDVVCANCHRIRTHITQKRRSYHG